MRNRCWACFGGSNGALVGGLVLSSERVARFVRDGFPIVCLDRDVDSTAVPLVHVDNFREHRWQPST